MNKDIEIVMREAEEYMYHNKLLDGKSYRNSIINALLATLYDLGKVSINPNILEKQGTLTPLEWDEMRRHPEIGFRIAQATPELASVSELILSHHERWDGKGYPRGLKGEDIPLACRILAVMDAYDAMTQRLLEMKQKLIKIKQWMLKPAKNLKGINSLLCSAVFEVNKKIGGK